MNHPLIAITTDLFTRHERLTARVTTAYADRVLAAGGQPVLLAPPTGTGTEPDPAAADALVARFDGFILTGGDDPRTEPFGAPSHPQITPVFAQRQAFESALLESIARTRPERPLFGICLGMQMMTLHAGGSLHQFMPETHPKTHTNHWGSEHEIVPEPEAAGTIEPGVCHSHHKQAVDSPGELAVLARAPDGVIEAVGDPSRPFHLGVQWHPERTKGHPLGQRLFERFVRTASELVTQTPV
ncbi:MAG: putative glutamine amidotransferase [Phycisphaerales bacterium]|jgi:putative glutamine amidotransferase